MSFFAHWVHNLDPFVIKFNPGGPIEGIRWYGLAYLLGFIIAMWLLHIYHKKGKSPFDNEDQTTLITALILGVIVGGRLGYMLLYDLPDFIRNPLIFFKFWEPGMASHGGFIGVCVAILWVSRHTHQPIFTTADICATLAPPGFFLGRIANFINGELWGKISDVSWAVIFPASSPHPGIPLEYIPARHPSQLYEAMLEGAILLAYTQWRFWSKKPRRPGALGGEFLIGYAILRIIGEAFREPDASLILGLSRGTFYSLLTAIFGLIILTIAHKKPREKHHNE
ncbi:MAG TPA: prolipoprotein diacylglyceryl transferase [Opitutae bacterium]|nr:prolipoprotein diacylglyceryl transferase [Opitutae bacterium]